MLIDFDHQEILVLIRLIALAQRGKRTDDPYEERLDSFLNSIENKLKFAEPTNHENQL